MSTLKVNSSLLLELSNRFLKVAQTFNLSGADPQAILINISDKLIQPMLKKYRDANGLAGQSFVVSVDFKINPDVPGGKVFDVKTSSVEFKILSPTLNVELSAAANKIASAKAVAALVAAMNKDAPATDPDTGQKYRRSYEKSDFEIRTYN